MKTIIQAVNDPNLFQPFLGNLDSWANWFTALKVLYGLPVKAKRERELIHECTGRGLQKLPKDGFKTALFLTGRRSGKSRTAAVIGAYEAVLAGHESKLSKGETGVVAIVSPTKSQSRVVHTYLRSIFDVPLLAAEIVKESRGYEQSFELKNGNRIEVLTGDWKSVRGFTLIAAIIDEACFLGYDSESKVKSDTELIRALEPSLATVGGKLICISTPYARAGWCYSQWKRHYGDDTAETLVWNCPSRTMNPTLAQRIVDKALADDLEAAKAEYLGRFREDVVSFIPRHLIEALVVKGRTELPPNRRHRYSAFCDMAQGVSGGDDATIAIGHMVDRKIILDFIRRWRPPFNPERVVGEMAECLHTYNIDRIVGDHHAQGFVKDAFESRRIRFARVTTNVWSDNPRAKTAKPKRLLYLEMLPRLCSGGVEILDNELLINQLAALERKTSSGGNDFIDHPSGQHDDLANALAGVCDAVSHPMIRIRVGIDSCQDDDPLAAVQQRMEDWDRRQAEYDTEQEMLRQPEDPMENFPAAFSEQAFRNL